MFVPPTKPVYVKPEPTITLSHEEGDKIPVAEGPKSESLPEEPIRRLKRITKEKRQPIKGSLPEGVPVLGGISIQLREGPMDEKGGRPRSSDAEEKGDPPKGVSQHR